ncbi:hypothetical protein RvY_17503-2 [Ramazzottius varieornatus]|uniref:Uncharacterized protein n=1 Tax=Ramazzottius varieornatus TaxID=947166 RepID=A0A1D1W4I7_RAMVA|nr:hypothetical protein RvY_17503-2 [Ramazzottius varieornatus]
MRGSRPADLGRLAIAPIRSSHRRPSTATSSSTTTSTRSSSSLLKSSYGSLDNYVTAVRLPNLVTEVGAEVDALARLRQLHAQVDQQRLLWPASLPSEQLEELKVQLPQCVLEKDVRDNEEAVSEEEALSEEPFSIPCLMLLLSVCRTVKPLVATWTCTTASPVSFRSGSRPVSSSRRHRIELAACPFLGSCLLPNARRTAPPYKMADHCLNLDFYGISAIPLPKETAPQERAAFQRQLKDLLKDGPLGPASLHARLALPASGLFV